MPSVRKQGPGRAGQLLILASGPDAAREPLSGPFTAIGLDLALAAGGKTGLPLLAALSGQWHAAVDAGHGREDASAARLALKEQR